MSIFSSVAIGIILYFVRSAFASWFLFGLVMCILTAASLRVEGGDILTYVGMARSGTYFPALPEPVFYSINYLSRSLFDDARTSVFALQALNFVVFSFLAIFFFKRPNILLIVNPYSVLFFMNSLQQGLSVGLFLAGVGLFIRGSIRASVVAFLGAASTHVAGLVAVLAIFLFYCFRRLFESGGRARILGFSAVGVLVAVIVFPHLLQVLGKFEYYRDEDFGLSRFGDLFKGGYLLVLGVIPLFLAWRGPLSSYLVFRSILFIIFSGVIFYHSSADAIFRTSYYLIILDLFLVAGNYRFDFFRFNKNRGCILVFFIFLNPSGVNFIIRNTGLI